MHSSTLENQLIVVDIVGTMGDYVSLQPDIDDSKIKAAAIVAQNIDIKRVIGEDNLDRCVDPDSGSTDEALQELVIPALCYYTYARALKMFPGTFTDSGYNIDTESTDKETSKAVANEHYSIAEAFMEDVISFLEDEDDTDVDSTKLTPSIRVFGGKEYRASN